MTTTTSLSSGGSWEGVSVAAENYERDLVPALFSEWAQDLVRLVELRAGERVIDFASGTGIVARTAAPLVGEFGSVTALDVNPDMLAVGRRMTAEIRPRIEWRLGSALDTGLPDAAFDAAFCQQGLQFFADRTGALREIRRILKPGGRMAASVWCDTDNPGYAPFATAFKRHLVDVPEAYGFVRAIFALHDAEELRELLSSAGFRDVVITRRSRMVRFPSPRAWAQAFVGAAPVPGLVSASSETLERIMRDAEQGLRPLVRAGRLEFPIAANVVLARR